MKRHYKIVEKAFGRGNKQFRVYKALPIPLLRIYISCRTSYYLDQEGRHRAEPFYSLEAAVKWVEAKEADIRARRYNKKAVWKKAF